MPGWREEYLASLQAAEDHDPVRDELVQACSQLADRISALQAEIATLKAAPSVPHNVPATASKEKSQAQADLSTPVTGDDTTTAKLRLALAEALRSNGQLTLRLKAAEDETLRLRNRASGDARTIRELESERDGLIRKVRDRDEELRVKLKHFGDVQDELTVLTLQLNVAEQTTAKVQAENKSLVDRWMWKMGQEAEAMNRANEPRLAKRE